MEDLVLEFEVKSEDNPKLKGFMEEVQEKLDSMTSFKKTFQRFQFSVDTLLKKVVHGVHSHTCTHTHLHTL